MPRFYFHISSKDEFLPDTKGAELEDLGMAHAYALRLILSMMQTFSDAADWRGWRAEVTDEEWRTVLVVLFPDRLPEVVDHDQALTTSAYRCR
jgi:hypothetical protein